MRGVVLGNVAARASGRHPVNARTAPAGMFKSPSSTRGAGSARADTAEPDAPPPDPELVDRLRSLRNQLAVAQSVPAYVIFNNKTLDAIARRRPTSETELAAVPGIGPNRLDAYGADILAAVRGA